MINQMGKTKSKEKIYGGFLNETIFFGFFNFFSFFSFINFFNFTGDLNAGCRNAVVFIFVRRQFKRRK